jgi:DNA-binding TFAR19-related protein (PDSD5 family)
VVGELICILDVHAWMVAVNRIAVHHPEVVARIEQIITRMARQGQLEGKVRLC